MMTASFDVAVNRIYAAFGMAAEFTARDEAVRPCTVLIDHNLTNYGDVARVAGKTVVISMRLAEVEAMPRRGDTVKVIGGPEAGRSYTVETVINSDGIEHRMTAV